jgi:hypothetical protein
LPAAEAEFAAQFLDLARSHGADDFEIAKLLAVGVPPVAEFLGVVMNG